MRKLIGLVIVSILLLTSCFLLGGGPRTLTGTINGTTVNVVVAAFSDDYWFLDDNITEDEVESEFGGATNISPLAIGTISGTSFSITLPDDVTTVGDLIAWVDTDLDGIFDIGSEQGYFPRKSVDGVEYVVSIGYLLESYTYQYYDGSTNYIISIETDSDASGFLFYVD